MIKRYDNCEYCNGNVNEKRIHVDLRHRGKLFVFENVPVGVCCNCGEKYYRGPVMERLEELAAHEELFSETIQVPCFDFAEATVE